MEIVPLKNNLLCDFRFNEVRNIIIKQLTDKSLNDPKYKLDNELLTYVTNLIEYLITKKDDKINKKDLALDIYRSIFSATPEELDLISRNIDYLHSNKVIKKVSYYRLFKTCFLEWFRGKRKE